MEEKLIKETEKLIKEILDNGISTTNLENLYKLSKIRHFVKEEEKMYGNYGRPGYDSYGRDGYGRRGYDAKYRGYDHLDRVGEYYGRYMDGNGRYGAEEENKHNLQSMLECMEQFARTIKEQAQTPEEQQMMKSAFSRIAM